MRVTFASPSNKHLTVTIDYSIDSISSKKTKSTHLSIENSHAIVDLVLVYFIDTIYFIDDMQSNLKNQSTIIDKCNDICTKLGCFFEENNEKQITIKKYRSLLKLMENMPAKSHQMIDIEHIVREMCYYFTNYESVVFEN